MSRKVLMLGVDGAPLNLVTKWAGEGELPNLRRLLDSGGHGVLASRVDLTPPAWSSIYTGKNPGKHGIFDFMRHKPGTYDFVPVSSLARGCADLWETLSSQGFTVGVLNAPLTYPPRPVNGFLVSGFLTPGDETEYTYPRSLKAELRSAAPGFRPSSSNELQVSMRKEAYAADTLRKLEGLREAAIYLQKRETDFFAVFVSETDFVSHWFWEDMLRQGQSASGGVKSGTSRVILDTYRAVDRMLGDLTEGLKEDVHVIVLSDHGSTYLRRFFHTNYFLYSKGLLQFRRDLRTGVKQAFYRSGITQGLYRLILRTNLYWMHYALRPITLSVSDVEWQRTVAYARGYGQIYLNVRGREPAGVVAKENLEETRRKIIENLNQVRDPKGDVRAMEAVYSKEEIFHGDQLDYAPDIQLVMAEGYEAFPWATMADDVFTDYIDRTGTHNTQGMLLLSGPGVRNGSFSNATVTDVAPTILYLMGVPIPTDLDGRFLSQAFTDEYVGSNPPRFANPSGPDTGRKDFEFSPEDEKAIEDNLRSLGYV